MADDLHYVPGDFYRIDDRTGFKVRAGKTRKEWTGLIVEQARWERRHPQDFVGGVRDDQTVPDPRPRQVDMFIAQGAGAEFEVYMDLPSGPAPSFLVQNALGPLYNTSFPANPANPSNTAGTAMITVYNGTIPAVTPESL